MSNTSRLHEFIGTNRDELIARCQAKVAKRSAPPATGSEVDHGVPLFLEQLLVELRDGPSKAHEIKQSAGRHGRDLLQRGFTVSQVVHDYGDVCQSVTDLAVHLSAPIATDDFRTMNRCLDDAIAGAVTEYARQQRVARGGQSSELLSLLATAIAGLEVLQTGNVGIAGSTGTLVHGSLISARALVERSREKVEEPESH